MEVKDFISTRLQSSTEEKPVNINWLLVLCKSYGYFITKQELEELVINAGYKLQDEKIECSSTHTSSLPQLFSTQNLLDLVEEDDIFSYTHRDNDELLERFKHTNDPKYYDRLVELNIPLVKSIAKRFLQESGTMTFEDLVQEGVIGMIKAIEKFDASLEYKFSTYATWWIRQRISRAVDDYALLIRIPVHRLAVIKNLRKFEQKLLEEQAFDLEKVLESFNYTRAYYDNIKLDEAQFMSVVSTNIMIGEGEDSELEQFISVDSSPSSLLSVDAYNNCDPVKVAEAVFLSDYLDNAMDCLTDREENVLRLRFGLDDGRERTLEQIGDVFGVTRERIRQIEAKALRKLRGMKNRKLLQDFLA